MSSSFSLESRDASEFPLMVVTSIVYPCNFGCPNCPYTDENSDLRVFYRKNNGDRLPRQLWDKISDECGEYGSFIRCTGGGEPMLHPELPEMIASAKEKRAKIWLNTNGSMFGPDEAGRDRLRKVVQAKVDVIEFSMDASDANTYERLRPTISGKDKRNAEDRWQDQLSNIREALALRDIYSSFDETKILVSMIRQKELQNVAAAEAFWKEEVGVDNVITRKFLTWDANTTLSLENSLDNIYETSVDLSSISPCVWLFERLNIDTLGRFALCGQDISFTTSDVFPNLYETSIKDVWHSEIFKKYRALHLAGNAGNIEPCANCSAWKAGVRDWNYGWLNVLKNATITRTVNAS